MSNRRRPKWTAEQITAANAEQLLAELAEVVAVEKDPDSRSLLLQVWDQLDARGRAGEFPALAEEFRADAARTEITRRLVADLQARGHDPGAIALAEQKLMELGTDYWAGLYRDMAAG